MSTGTISTATPRRVNAAWQAATALRAPARASKSFRSRRCSPGTRAGNRPPESIRIPDPCYDLARDQDHRGAVAIGFVEAIDEMQAAGTATACASRQTTGELRLGLRCEGAGFLVTHMDPIDLA